MQLNIFDVFQSITVIILIDAPIVSSMVSGSLFKLPPESFWLTLVAFNRFFAFWQDKIFQAHPVYFPKDPR